MSNLEDNRLVKLFAQLRQGKRQTLAPFLTAGFPDLETTLALLKDFEARGVAVCELGIPFSDPIADGAVIQASYTHALAQGVHLQGILDMVARYRREGGKLALVSMVSYSIVFRRGVARYLADAAAAGFDALIVPDLPLEEAAALEEQAAKANLASVMLIAPSTPPDRQREIARHSRGFIYYVSIAGVTGERDKLPPATIAAVAELRKLTETPICVGFGISNAATVAAVCQVAEGAIVGSAIVRRIDENKRRSRDELVTAVGGFVSELLKGLP